MIVVAVMAVLSAFMAWTGMCGAAFLAVLASATFGTTAPMLASLYLRRGLRGSGEASAARALAGLAAVLDLGVWMGFWNFAALASTMRLAGSEAREVIVVVILATAGYAAYIFGMTAAMLERPPARAFLARLIGLLVAFSTIPFLAIGGGVVMLIDRLFVRSL